ncbi:MAG: NYN domain-containing protein [Pyrinomonadaceae bacterium]
MELGFIIYGSFEMSRIVFLVDGFNLYHALDYSPNSRNPKQYNKYKWLSLTKLAQAYITSRDKVAGIYYFTTLATWDRGKMARHKLFIRANEIQGVQVVYGEFKRKQKRCNLCHKFFWTVEEKQTDVNIALKLFQLAVQDIYDKAIIISGDTDLLPAVKTVQTTFPTKSIGVVIPIGRASEDFKNNADFHYKMKEHQLQTSRFQDTIVLSDESTIECPPKWR